jgi:probable DNA metabolism protein
MVTVVYDGTFEGWLTAVFEVYEYKFDDVTICTKATFQQNVFNRHHNCLFDAEKASRVYTKLTSKLSKLAVAQIYKAFLSEEKGMEDVLLEYVRRALLSKQSIEDDFSNLAVLTVVQTAKKVHREKHRMEAFIRFQLTGDQIYYAVCEPDFNVLPLIAAHFKNRYADQRWIIYDSKRFYGMYYNLSDVENITMTFEENTAKGRNIELIVDEKEELYQKLWQRYFKSVNIAARKNTKLHVQHMPKRYWKFLVEKQPQS